MSLFLQHIINGVGLGSIYALLALGYTMVYGVLGLINFAHADVYMMGAFFAYYSAKFFSLADGSIFSFLVAMFAAIVGCSILGVTIERFAYRPLRKAPKINILITAIGVSLLLEYGGQVIFGADPKFFPQLIVDKALLSEGMLSLRLIDLVILLVSFVAMVILHFIIMKTKSGRAMRALSVSSQNATLMGVNVDKTITITFIIGSSLAAVASVLIGLKYPKIEPLMGMLMGLKAFVAAVFGGIGSIPGAVVGGLFLGLAEEFVVAYISSSYRDAFAFFILIVILIVKPTGIFGKSSKEKV